MFNRYGEVECILSGSKNNVWINRVRGEEPEYYCRIGKKAQCYFVDTDRTKTKVSYTEDGQRREIACPGCTFIPRMEELQKGFHFFEETRRKWEQQIDN